MKKLFNIQVALLFIWALISGIAQGQVPQLMNYQGILTDPETGDPIPDDTYQMIFSIYDTPSGGSAIWSETRSVGTQDGLYNVLLGSTTPLTPSLLEGTEKYLGVQVGADPEMTPRKRMVSVAYAITSSQVSGSSNIFPSDGKVGIGTTDPKGKLHIKFGGSGAANFIEDGAIFENNGNGWWVVTIPNTRMGGLMVTDPDDFDEARLYYNHADNSWHIDGNGTQELFSINSAGIAVMKGFQLITAPSEGYVLTSDAAGVGTWQPAGGGGLTLPYAGTTSSSSTAFSITTTGTGDAGSFEINNSGNSGSAIHAATNGLGFAGDFRINNPGSSQPALHGFTNGSGAAVFGNISGTGRAGDFQIFNESNSEPALHGHTNGSGAAVAGNNSGTGPAIYGITHGTGEAGHFYINNPANSSSAIHASTNGTGSAGYFRNTNSEANEPTVDAATNGNFAALYGYSNGNGKAGYFIIDNVNNANDGITVTTNGRGSAAFFEVNNFDNEQPALNAITNGKSAAISAGAYGTGEAGRFMINNSTNPSTALVVATGGTGGVAEFQNSNSENSSTLVQVGNNGLGPCATFYNGNTNNDRSTIEATTHGSGPAVSGVQNGTGVAGNFDIANSSNDRVALHARTLGMGGAASFSIENSSNSVTALECRTNGVGQAFVADHTGSSGNIAIFQSDGANQARIDKTGKGFFNGGTQTGGADLAEALQVVDAIQSYEPGDVLIISTNHNSKFEKSNNAYSTLVAGVYATKPGVLLCDRGIDDSLDDTIPVGIVGIIPTKVSGENGSIKRGDLLVTSNTPGHAMKGTDREQLLGAIIGKALEDFEGSGTGVIKVLVNVK